MLILLKMNYNILQKFFFFLFGKASNTKFISLWLIKKEKDQINYNRRITNVVLMFI